MEIKIIVAGKISTNMYIVYDKNTREGIVIDPGDDAEKIIAFIKQESLDIKRIFLTHGHYDHIMALDPLKEYTGAKTAVFEDEKQILKSSQKNLSVFDKPTETTADIYLKERDTFEFSGNVMEVIHTPGHTPGSCCYYFPEQKVLFSGDTLFFETVGRTDFPYGSTENIISSLKDKLLVLPEDTKVFPGHDRSTTIGHEKKHNPYA